MAARVTAAAVRVRVGNTDVLVERGGLLPAQVDADTVKRLMAKGMVKQFDPPKPEPEAKAEVEPDTGDTPVAKMTVGELREYAAEHDIDLGDATRKDDILAAIAAAQV